jgi:hypothetical protein
LWNTPENYLYISPIAADLISYRSQFITKKFLSAVLGYAMEQRDRMLQQNAYKGYMGAKRKELVDKYGYDIKFAAHVIRLACLGIEAAIDGTAFSYRPKKERELILSIKAGEVSYYEVMRLINANLELFKRAKDKAMLPESVNFELVNDLLIGVLSVAAPK